MATTLAAFYDSDGSIGGPVPLAGGGTGISPHLRFKVETRVDEDFWYKGQLLENFVAIVDSDGLLIDLVAQADSAALLAQEILDEIIVSGQNIDSDITAALNTINTLVAAADSDVNAAITLVNLYTAAADSDYQASLVLVQQATAQADAAILAADSAYGLSITTIQSLVSLADNALANIDAAYDSAIAVIDASSSSLQSQIDSINSTLTTNYYTIVQTDSAITFAVSAAELSLQSSIDSNKSAIEATLDQNYYTLTQADSAIALAVSTSQSTLQSNIDSNLSTLENDYYTIVQTDGAITTAVSAAQQTLQSNINAINSNLSTNYYTSAQTDSEISTSLAAIQNILQSNIDSVSSTLTTDYYTRTEVDSEVATSVASAQTALQSNIDNVNTNLSTNYYTISTVDGIARASDLDVDSRFKSGGSYSDKVCLLTATYTFAVLEDGTELFKNGSLFATLNRGQTTTEALTEGDIISATNAFNATSNSIQLASILHGGTRFTQYRTRNANIDTTYVKIYPLRSGSAYYLFNDYSSGDHDFAVSSSNNPTSLTEGTVTTLTLTPTSTDDGDFTLETTVPCLVYIGNSSRGDENILYPTAERILGEGAAVKVDNGDTLLSNGTLYYIDNYVGQLSLHTTGDGAGADTMAYQPYEFLGNEYIVPQTSIADYKIFTDKNITVYVRDASGTQIGLHNIDGSTTPTSLAVGDQSGAGTNISTNGPFYFTGTGKFALRTNNTGTDDEYSVIGHDKELKSSFVNEGLGYSLSAIKTLLQSNIDSNQASLEQNYYTIVEADSEIATAITNLQTILQSNIDSNQASLETNYYTISEADAAIAAAQLILQSNIDSNQAILQTDYYTISQTNNVVASAQQTLQSNIDSVNSSLTTKYYTITEADIAISTAQQTLQSNIDSNQAILETNYYTISQTNQVVSNAQQTLQSNIDSNQAILETNYYTISQTNNVVASAQQTLQSNIDSVNSSLTTNYYTITDVDNEIVNSISIAQQTLQSNIDSNQAFAEQNFFTILQGQSLETDLQGLIGDLNISSTGSVLSSEYVTGISSSGWSYWTTAGTETLTNNEVFSITNGSDTIFTGNTVRFDVASNEYNGLFTTSLRSHWTGSQDYQAYRVEIVFSLVSGTLDGAGVLFDWRNTGGTNYRTQIKLADMLGTPVITGVPLTASAVFVKPENFTGTFSYHNVYIMANYNGFTPVGAKDIKFHKISIKPATEEEQGGGVVGTEITKAISALQTTLQSNIDSNYTTITETIATVDGIQAQYSLQIDNNGAISGYRLISDPNTNSAFIVTADQFAVISPDGADSSGPMFQVVTEPEELAGVYIRGARINPGGVNTLQITSRAVTNQSSVNVSSANFFNTSNATVASLTFSSPGNEQVLVGASFILAVNDQSPGGNQSANQFSIRFNNNTLTTSGAFDLTYNEQNHTLGPFSLLTDSGTNTLLLRTTAGNQTTMEFSNVNLFALEALK